MTRQSSSAPLTTSPQTWSSRAYRYRYRLRQRLRSGVGVRLKVGGILRRVKAGVLGGAVPSPARGLGFAPENKINFALKITQF